MFGRDVAAGREAEITDSRGPGEFQTQGVFAEQEGSGKARLQVEGAQVDAGGVAVLADHLHSEGLLQLAVALVVTAGHDQSFATEHRFPQLLLDLHRQLRLLGEQQVGGIAAGAHFGCEVVTVGGDGVAPAGGIEQLLQEVLLIPRRRHVGRTVGIISGIHQVQITDLVAAIAIADKDRFAAVGRDHCAVQCQHVRALG